MKDGAFSKSLDRMWYPSSGTVGASLLADLQALLSAGDDVLASQRDESCVVTIGKYVRIERLEVATLVVVAQRPASYITCQSAISYSTRVLKQRM